MAATLLLRTTDSKHLIPNNKPKNFTVAMPKWLAFKGHWTLEQSELYTTSIAGTTEKELFIYFDAFFVCSADQMTTVAQETTKATSEPTKLTTEPSASNVTTVGPSNVTTEKTTVGLSNATTRDIIIAPITVASNTSPPFPPVSRYAVVKRVFIFNKIICVVMEGSFQLKVTYRTKDNKMASKIVNVPARSDVTVNGTCASGIDTESSLMIKPIDREIQSLTFIFKIMDGKSYLYSWSAEVDLTKFPDAIESELIHSVNGTPVELSSPESHYKCIKGGTFSDDILTLMFRELKVQAFNVEDGNFSDCGYDCPEDTGPIPDPGNPPVHSFSVTDGNITCIVFRAGIKFNISYTSQNGDTTEVISLPVNYNGTGDCNTTLNGFYSQKMVVSFYNSWELTIYFSSDVQQSEYLITTERVTKYHISQIELVYDFNNNLFTNVTDSSE
ncbi:lysosome-associated membrane glycoprotein 1-like [Saccostrea cucullata]|uniref:lysosome-associated membrane glycoprotein 1-like n=1 Tax=Saccostrea cuccullata TaxID=36930 RepID=UPI002ED2843F